jgi:hypothetical protein
VRHAKDLWALVLTWKARRSRASFSRRPTCVRSSAASLTIASIGPQRLRSSCSITNSGIDVCMAPRK